MVISFDKTLETPGNVYLQLKLKMEDVLARAFIKIIFSHMVKV